jgi:oxaloacetate decarboxylase alpha subunit
VPRLYDERIYQHRVPGGVIANLEFQLKQLGLHHRLDEILDEIKQIVIDLGYPVQMTPHSQFIVTQATMNVALGERYKEFIDAMTEYALGIYGTEDTGVDIMDQNLKDKFLNGPNAKRIAEWWAQKQEEDAIEYSFDELKAKYGAPGATDEQFWNHYWGLNEGEMVALRYAPKPKSYYFGKEPLVVLLNELKKDHDISRLELRKGNNLFDFRSK